MLIEQNGIDQRQNRRKRKKAENPSHINVIFSYYKFIVTFFTAKLCMLVHRVYMRYTYLIQTFFISSYYLLCSVSK